MAEMTVEETLEALERMIPGFRQQWRESERDAKFELAQKFKVAFDQLTDNDAVVFGALAMLGYKQKQTVRADGARPQLRAFFRLVLGLSSSRAMAIVKALSAKEAPSKIRRARAKLSGIQQKAYGKRRAVAAPSRTHTAAASRKPGRPALGARVMAVYPGKRKRYPGVVEKASEKDALIRWDDGDRPRRVQWRHIEQAPQPAPGGKK